MRSLIVSFVVLVYASVVASAGPVYVVSGVKSGVKAKKSKSTAWIALNRLDKIGVLDSLEIAPGGGLDFYNAGDGRRYHVDSGKKLRVSDAVSMTKIKGKKGVIESVISTGFPPEDKERRRPAATHRGSEDDDSLTQAIYSVYISGQSASNSETAWIAKQQADGFFRLIIGNKGVATLFVELYAVRRDGRVERIDIMDEANTPLVGGATVELPFEFAYDSDINYMLVSCTQPFDPASLAHMINTKKAVACVDNCGPIAIVILYAE